MNAYTKCVKLLTSKEKFHIELGLGRVAQILNILGNPQDKIKTIHIAGTNGKGSTCAILNCILQECGYKVGLFTSPHLVKYNERIQVNSSPISDDALCSILQEINQISQENNIYLTEFEILTVAGFLYFARENVDFAVIEVGLGGRLDATNVIKNPLICAITSLSKDHVDRLGDTIEKIAFEKAGIIKNNSICCVLENNAGINVIEKYAGKANANLKIKPILFKTQFLNGKNYAQWDDELIEFALIGKYQEENLSLVLGIVDELKKLGIEISEKKIKNSLKKVVHRGRFEVINELNLVIDGAHNPDGAKVLRTTLDEFYSGKNITFIYATISTKDYKSILKTILRKGDDVKLLAFSHPSAVEPQKLLEIIDNDVEIIDLSQINDVIIQNKKNNKITVITGSLYAIGEIYGNVFFTKNSPLG